MPSNKKDVRMCCACHGRADKSELLRIVKTPDGNIIIDDGKKADGRGVWVHLCDECIGKVVKRKMLNHAFKTGVPEEIYEQLKSK